LEQKAIDKVMDEQQQRIDLQRPVNPVQKEAKSSLQKHFSYKKSDLLGQLRNRFTSRKR